MDFATIINYHFSACQNFWSCCSKDNPCEVTEGDCDLDNHCIGDLICGVSNCGPTFPKNADCCDTGGKEFK